MDGEAAGKEGVGAIGIVLKKKIVALKKNENTNGDGEKPNKFAGATLELKHQLTRAIDAIERKDKEHALAICEAKIEAQELHNQVSALAHMINKLSAEMKTRPNRRTKRRLSITPTASSDKESKSESKEEPPTPAPKTKEAEEETKENKNKVKDEEVIQKRRLVRSRSGVQPRMECARKAIISYGKEHILGFRDQGGDGGQGERNARESGPLSGLAGKEHRIG